MSKFIDLTGKKFNKLTVVKRLENSIGGVSVWLCQCECGNFTTVRGSNIKNGSVKSCGCLLKEGTTTTHGLSKTKIYGIWNSIKSRCLNPNSESYKRYGARGICVCEEWKNSFESFYLWSIENGYNEKLSIERIDNDGNYCPQNCKWASRKEQCRNRRSNVVFEYMGEKRILTEWCEILNLDYKLVHNRIHKMGWSFEKSILTPKNSKLERAKNGS